MRLGASRRSASQTAMLTPRCRGAVRPKLLDTIRLTQIRLRTRGRYVYQSPYEETVPADVPQIGGLKRVGTDARERPDRPRRARLRRPAQRLHPARPRHRRRARQVHHRHRPLERARSVAPVPGAAGPRPQWGAGYFGLTGQRLPSMLEVGGRGAHRRLALAPRFRSAARARSAARWRSSPAALRIARGRGRRRVGAGRFRDSGRETRTVSSDAGPARRDAAVDA